MENNTTNKNAKVMTGRIFQGYKNHVEKHFDEYKTWSYSNESRIIKRRKLKGKIRNSMNLIK